MTPAEITIFNAAVALANQGEKQSAHAQLRVLENTNPNEVSLLLWLAFTAPSLDQAEALLIRASSIDPTNPSLAQAKSWLAQEKAKQAPPVVQPAPVVPVAPAAYNYNWPANFPGGPAPYGMPPGQPPYNYQYPYQQPGMPQFGYGYYNPAIAGYPAVPYGQLPQFQVKKLGFWAGFGYYILYLIACIVVLAVVGLIVSQFEPTRSYYLSGHYYSGKDGVLSTVVNFLILLVAAIWATIDASNRRARYGKEANSHPALVCIGCILLGGFIFSAYLVQRQRKIVAIDQSYNSWGRFSQ